MASANKHTATDLVIYGGKDFRNARFYFNFYTVQENKTQNQTANYLHSCLLFLEIKF